MTSHQHWDRIPPPLGGWGDGRGREERLTGIRGTVTGQEVGLLSLPLYNHPVHESDSLHFMKEGTETQRGQGTGLGHTAGVESAIPCFPSVTNPVSDWMEGPPQLWGHTMKYVWRCRKAQTFKSLEPKLVLGIMTCQPWAREGSSKSATSVLMGETEAQRMAEAETGSPGKTGANCTLQRRRSLGGKLGLPAPACGTHLGVEGLRLARLGLVV